MILGGIAMKTLGIKIWDSIKRVFKYLVVNFREIFTTLLEICAVGVIAIGVSINWGNGWGLIVGGMFALIMSFLSSFDPKQLRGNQ
jgi:hypothetical protein